MNIFFNLKIKTIYLQRKINKKISEKKHSSSAFRKTVNKVFHFINKIAQDARKTILLSKILYAYIAYRWKTLSMQFNSKKATRKMMLFRDYILLKWDYIKDNLYLSATGLYYLSVILRKLVFSNIWCILCLMATYFYHCIKNKKLSVPSNKKQSSFKAAKRTDMKGYIRCLKCGSCWSALPIQRNLTTEQTTNSASVEIANP